MEQASAITQRRERRTSKTGESPKDKLKCPNFPRSSLRWLSAAHFASLEGQFLQHRSRWEGRSLIPAPPLTHPPLPTTPPLPLALSGRGSLGLKAWLSPRGGRLAAAGGGTRSSPLPDTAAVAALRRPWRSPAGARKGREQPGRGGRGASLGRTRGGARAARALGCGGGGNSISLPWLPFGLFLFLLLSFAPSVVRSPRLLRGGALRVSQYRGGVSTLRAQVRHRPA